MTAAHAPDPALSYTLDLIAAPDPYPVYRRLRDEDPAHYSPAEDLWVLTRYEDVAAALKDWRTWSSARRGNLVHDIPARIGKTLGTTDPPAHTFARGLVDQAFTPRTVEAMRPRIASLAGDLVAGFRRAGGGEFVSAVSAPFNAAVLGAMFGVPGEDFIRLRRWLDDFFQRESASAGREPKQVTAMRHLREYIDGLAARAESSTGGEDLLARMLHAEADGRRLEREQAVVTTMTFLTAGFESTNNLFTNLAYALAVHPDVRAALRAAPARIPEFIEEGIRWDAPAQGFVRTPTRPVALHGRSIPADAQVLLHLGAANRDERAFADPDRFDLDRPRRRNLGFGLGVHFCVGAPLGRTMAGLLFSELMAQSRGWQVDLDHSTRVTTPNFRGFSKLRLEI